jgi:hypothetical protein
LISTAQEFCRQESVIGSRYFYKAAGFSPAAGFWSGFMEAAGSKKDGSTITDPSISFFSDFSVFGISLTSICSLASHHIFVLRPPAQLKAPP